MSTNVYLIIYLPTCLPLRAVVLSEADWCTDLRAVPLQVVQRQCLHIGQGKQWKLLSGFGVPQVWTYACVRQRFDKMANMPSLGNKHTHTPIRNTIQYHIWAGNNACTSHMCTRYPKTGQGLVLYSILFGKTMPPSTISNKLCVVTQLRRPIYNSAVAEWAPRILFWVDRKEPRLQ